MAFLDGDVGLRALSVMTIRDSHDPNLQNAGMHGQHALQAYRRDVLTAGNDDILCTVQNLDSVIRVPDSEISSAQNAAFEKGSGGYGILVVSVCANVASEDNFSNLFSIPGDIDDSTRNRGLLFDDADKISAVEALALTSHLLVELSLRKVVPFWEEVGLSYRAVGLGETIDMDGHKVEGDHLFEEAGGWGRGGDCNTDGFREFLGPFIITEKGADGGSGVEMGHALIDEETPDLGVVDLAEAVMGSPNADDGPRECPTGGMEQRERRKVFTPVVVGHHNTAGIEAGLDNV